MSFFSTPDSYERVYLPFDPMYRLMQERNITDLQLAQKVGVKVDVIRNIYKYQDTVTLSVIRRICEALDCWPGDLMTARKVEYIPAKKAPEHLSVRGGESRGIFFWEQGGRAGPLCFSVHIQPPRPSRPVMPDGQSNSNQPSLLMDGV